MIVYCPRCGAQFGEQLPGTGIELAVRCRDCGLTVGDPPPMLAKGADDDEVEYDLDEWPVDERGAATAALAGADIPYRWEPGLVLAVPAVAEAEVDLLLDQLDEADPLAGGADGADPDGEDEDGGEEAQAAMADLFVASDRLQHAPGDADVAADAIGAASIVRASAPPYGIERPVWRQMQALASALIGDLEEGADEELVADDARAVRDFLRDYV